MFNSKVFFSKKLKTYLINPKFKENYLKLSARYDAQK